MTRYLLACSCGSKIEVDAGQAGLAVRCSCGADVQVPSMRGLAALERAQEGAAPPAGKRQTEWGTSQALLFLGLVTAVAALLPAAYLWYTFPVHPRHVLVVDSKRTRAQLDGLTIEQVWDLWNRLRRPVSEQEKPLPMIAYELAAENHRQWLTLAGAAAGCGVLLAGVGLAIKPRPARPPKKRPAGTNP